MPIVNISNLQTFTAVNLLRDPGAIGGPVLVPSCAQIRLHWTLPEGKAGFNVLYGRYSGAFSGTVAQANAIFTALSTGGAATAYLALLGTAVSFAGVDIRDVNSANQPIIASSSAAVPGTNAAGTLPSEMAIVITERTALTGRANRGRIYAVGFTSAAVAAGNVVNPTTMTGLGNWALTIPTAFSASGYTLVIGQKARAAYTGKTGTQHPARAATSTPVTALLVRDNHFDSQRRRGLK